MRIQNRKPDFTGQHIYVGLDIGKKCWKVCILTEEVEHKTYTQPPETEVLINYLRRQFPGAHCHCAYEAGYCDFWIFQQLRKNEIDCIVVNPADVPATHKEQTNKNDRVDARKLGRSLRNGERRSIYVPERGLLEDWSLVRIRGSLVK